MNSTAALAAAPLEAPGHGALCAALGVEPDVPWVVDLTLGAWRPREAARQLAAQAEIALPPPPAGAPRAGASWADTVGTNIDIEAQGPTGVRIADADAALLHARLGDTGPAPLGVVWLPLADGLPDDNGWFLRLLAARLEASGGRLVLARRTPGSGLAASLACLEPHLLSAPGTGTWPLRGGAHLCCPSQRPLDWPVAARSRFDRLAAGAQAPAWLRAYAACHGNNFFVQSEALSDYAWSCHVEGATTLALRLLVRARDCARDPVERATIVARIQGIRIASQQFADAARETVPGANLPAPLREFLRQSVGWARIMQGDTEGLAAYFGEPGAAPADSREGLYAMNIHALGLARADRAADALEMELRIARTRQEEGIDDARLAYINNLNIARLYKARGELDAAARHYELAFATNYGVRTHAESAHAAWIRSSMARANGQAEAAGAWLMQAVLHWLADPLPEAVPVRLAQAVLGARLPLEEERVEAMSAAMLRALTQAVDEDQLACAPVAGATPAFTAMTAGVCVQAYYGWPGCAVGWSPAPAPVSHRGDAHAGLASLAARVLAACTGMPAAGSVIVDDGDGRELPRTRAELLALALARGATACVWQGERADIADSGAQALRRHLQLRRSPAFAALEPLEDDGWQLRYLRHGRVQRLNPTCAALIARLEREGPLGVAAPDGIDIPSDDAWRDTWASGAVDLVLPEAACTQAGISWHTNAT